MTARTKDFLWFTLVALVILALSSIPYWVGHSLETETLLFRGIYTDEADYSVHVAMMNAGRMGDWAYQMRFTSEEHRPAFVRMFYIILGHISGWIQLDVETTYHLARWVFGFIALFSIYRLCLKVFPKVSHARAAFLLATLGAGVGWLQLMLGVPLEPISPIDFWLIDAYIFFSISLFPSFSFTLALMATALNLFLNTVTLSESEGSLPHGQGFFAAPRLRMTYQWFWQPIALICLLAVLSQTTNPIAFAVIDLAFTGIVIFLWVQNRKIDRSQFIALTVIALSQLPLLIYNFLILSRDPFWSQFTAQNQTLSPPPAFYFWGFFPFLLFAVWGIVLSFREKNVNMVAMSSWAVSGFVLAYLPVFIQRRFILGITIPLGILAIYGFTDLLNRLPAKLHAIQKREGLLHFTYILLSSISSIYLVLGLSLFLQARPPEKFYPRDLGAALTWLDEHATSNDIVLASIQTSQVTAQKTDLKVYVGHEMETLQFDSKKKEMESFFEDTAVADWLSGTNIRWVIYSPYEQKLAPEFRPKNLQLVYENDTVKIYETPR